MAITGNIETSFKNRFREGFDQSFQQMRTLLRGAVMNGRQASEFDFMDRLGLADEMNEVTARFGDTPANDVPHERRRIGLRDFDWGKGVDDKDLIRVVSDPTNDYTQAAVFTANRKVDDIIIEAITADAFTGKAGGTTVTFVDTNAQKITVGAVSNENNQVTTSGDFVVTAGNVEGIDIATDYAPGGGIDSNITIEKMIAVRETMLRLEAIQPGDVLTWVLHPNQQSALLRLTELTSIDFNSTKVLVNGMVSSFMGFQFIYSNRIPLVSGTTHRETYVLGPKAIQLNFSKDTDVDIFRRPDKKNIPWILIKLGLGATRMWGEHAARVRCDETVA